MKFKGFLSTIVLACLPLATYASNLQVTCPDLNRITQSASHIHFTTRDASTGLFTASTQSPVFVEQGLKWVVAVDHILAYTAQDAVRIGKNSVKNANYKRNTNAFLEGTSQNIYVCFYGPSNVIAVGVDEWPNNLRN